MKYITIFHANLNYAYLTEDRYEFVIARHTRWYWTRQSRFWRCSSLRSVAAEQIAHKTPDVLENSAAIACGQCRSGLTLPHAPNFPREDGVWSIHFQKRFIKTFGLQLQSF
jgi:hypothetical protein